MVCLNYLCVYNFKNNCYLNEITLDINGVCESCILVEIDEEIINKKKLELLESLEN